MTRAYAIALGAGTQVFTILPWVVIFGPIGAADELPRTVLMTAGWVINLGVAPSTSFAGDPRTDPIAHLLLRVGA
jgi:hypothetical protein